MDFIKILQSLEELIYEAMTWLLFYPRTLWRSIRHPIQLLEYSQRELGDTPSQQFTDLISPPLFLMITILLSHGVELAAHQHLPEASTAAGRAIAASEQNLLLLRCILFAIYPLMFASRRLKRQGIPVDRDALRSPFYAQCYVAAPAAFVIGIGTILGRTHDLKLQIVGSAITLLAILWYIGVEATWLKIQLGIGRARATLAAFRTWLAATVINSLVSLAILGI
jgi:hypothetical protein